MLREKFTAQYKVELVEKDGGHHYRKDGMDIYYPGVTTIQQAFPKQLYLVPWGAKLTAQKLEPYLNIRGREGLLCEDADSLIREAKAEHKRVKEVAGTLGSDFHAMADSFIKGNDTKIIPEGLEIAWKSFKLWIEKEKPDFIMSDTKVLHTGYGYGGSFDAVIEEDGEPIIIDFKTSNRIHIEYSSQIASYGAAFCKTYGIEELPGGRVVRFDKEKVKYEQKDVANMEKAFYLFRSVKQLYDALKLEYFVPVKKGNGKSIK